MAEDPSPSSQRRIAAGVLPALAVACAAALLAGAERAAATCNLIPAAVVELRSTQGTVDRPLAAPGETVTVRVDLACDATAPGFAVTASDNLVTLVFEPPAGASTVVPVSAGTLVVENCSLVRCDTLRFPLPDTDALLSPPGDGRGLTGPARIVVRNASDTATLAEIGPLFQPTLACGDQEPESVFERFTVLPPFNVFPGADGALDLLGTLDGSGALLLPFDFRAALPVPGSPGGPSARILQASGALEAFSGGPFDPIVIPRATALQPFEFVRSFTTTGRPIPPILEVDETGSIVFGTVDNVESVIRIARREPPAGAPLFELSDRLEQDRGPIVIPSALLAVRDAAPLESLRASRDVLASVNLAAGVAQVLDLATGATLAFANRVVSVSADGRTRPAAAAGGTLAAFLEQEAGSGDLNGDGDAFDNLLLVYETASAAVLDQFDTAVDPAPRVNGRPLVVSGDFVFFRRREGDASNRLTQRVSVTNAGAQATGGASSLHDTHAGKGPISADGRYVAFVSAATNLVAGDTNARDDVFVRDRLAGTTQRVSVASGGAQGDGHSGQPSLSADGRYVAFQSLATNLVAGDTNGLRDVFVHDRQTGVTERVSVATGGGQANGTSGTPGLGADGRLVVFESSALNLVAGDTNNGSDIFVHDRQTGVTERVSVSSSGSQGSGSSNSPSISADGRFIAFSSGANDLAPGDTNPPTDVFVRDRQNGTTALVSVSSAGAVGNNSSVPASISADGRFVAFNSQASNLVPGDTNNQNDVFVRDLQTGTTERVSVSSTGAQGNQSSSGGASLSADGRFVAFASSASNLVPGDTNGAQDVFVHDRLTRATERASVSATNAQATSAKIFPSLSADARAVAFQSTSTNLVAGDTNGQSDVFVRGIDSFSSFNFPADSDETDTVLTVFDAAESLAMSGPILEANFAASEVAVAAGRAVALVPEAEEGDTNLNPAGGDTDTLDSVALFFDPTTDTLTNLGVAATGIAISEDVVCLAVPEADENARLLDPDGDAEDSVLGVWTIGTPAPATLLAHEAAEVGASGPYCVFLQPEDARGPSGSDENGDGDTADKVLRVYDTATSSLLPLVRPAADFLVGGALVAFRSCESDEGPGAGSVLNSDGDTDDCVMRIYDLAAQALIETERAAVRCEFSGCDPFFEPYRVKGDTVSFVTLEADQAGPTTGPGQGAGCLLSSPPGGCDLNGDGDAADTLMNVYNVRSGKFQVYELSTGAPPTLSPFPETIVDDTVLYVQLTELQVNADVDEDGDIDATLMTFLVGDADEDGTFDDDAAGNSDTCRESPNAQQLDGDLDGLGSQCDPDDASLLPGAVPCDVDRDGVVDRTDVDLIFGDRGVAARASDPRDEDADAAVTVLDAGACAAQCTHPDCAETAPPAPGCGLLGVEALAALLALGRRLRRR